MRIVLLHQAVPAGAPADEQDVLEEVAAVEAALCGLGHDPLRLAVTLDLGAAARALGAARPDLVFNLVESLPGAGRGGKLAALPAALVESLGIPCTGSSAAALAATADKLLTKRRFLAAGIATPAWLPDGGAACEAPLIVKSQDEHASIGLGPESVVANAAAARALIAERAQSLGGGWFAETYIEGREFNLALLADGEGTLRLLPIAEQVFLETWPEGRPRILDYAGKWDPDDPTYPLVERRFGTADGALSARLEAIARACWQEFGLAGYARVDFRVDAAGTPFALEVNANPCLTPEMGMAAGAEAAGIDYQALIGHIIAAAMATPGRAGASGTPEGGRPTGVRAGTCSRAPFRTQTHAADVDAVEALARASAFFAPHEIAVARELAEAAAGGDPHYRMLYADGPEGLEGWAAFGPTPCTEGAWDLYWIVVHPRAQGQGLGTALLAEAARRAAREGGRALYAETAGKARSAPTRSFYAARGFRCLAELPDFYAAGDAKLIFRRLLA